MTESEKQIVLHVNMFRQGGFCAKGTKQYAESLGLNFKDLLAGRITLGDLEPHENDAFVKTMINKILGVKNG
jgi:hypothetical protein